MRVCKLKALTKQEALNTKTVFTEKLQVFKPQFLWQLISLNPFYKFPSVNISNHFLFPPSPNYLNSPRWFCFNDEIHNDQNQYITNKLLIVAMYSSVCGPKMTVMEVLS